MRAHILFSRSVLIACVIPVSRLTSCVYKLLGYSTMEDLKMATAKAKAKAKPKAQTKTKAKAKVAPKAKAKAPASQKREYKTADAAAAQKAQWEKKGYKVTRRGSTLLLKK